MIPLLKLKNEEAYHPFPKTGTHWSLVGAAFTLQQAAERFSWPQINIGAIEKSKDPYFTERDLANLLNLLFKYLPQKSFYKPQIKAVQNLTGKTTIIGDSFSNEFKKMAVESGLIVPQQLLHFANNPLKENDIKEILTTQRIIFVYMDLAFYNQNDQLLKKVDMLLNYFITAPSTIYFNKENTNIITDGFSHIEKTHRWTNGNKASIAFNLADFGDKSLRLSFDVNPYIPEKHPRLNVLIKVNGEPVGTWHFQKNAKAPDTQLVIPVNLMPNGYIKIEFEMDNPISPLLIGGSTDARMLGLAFKSMHLEYMDE